MDGGDRRAGKACVMVLNLGLSGTSVHGGVAQIRAGGVGHFSKQHRNYSWPKEQNLYEDEGS